MSIPGLGQAAPAARLHAPIQSTVTVHHDLTANSEWRFEVAVGQSIEVKVLSGTAELFGTELALNHVYTFRGTKAAIFSWHGCRLEVLGPCVEYIAEETPMVSYVNTHFALDKLRDEASEKNGEGPRVLVVGPSNSGKTSLVKMLTAYATRVGRQPMVINTDSREGMLSIPGSLTATPFASILDVEQGWGSSPSSGPSPVPVKLPLCYFYGSPSPEDNTKLYRPTISRLAIAGASRLAEDPDIKHAGMIIDTPGIISQGKENFDLISHIISEFQVNVVLVLGSERLNIDMHRRFLNYKTIRNEDLVIIRLDKSGGCIDRDEEYLRQTREAAIREYFFGDEKRTLSPHTQSVDINELTVYKVHEARTTDASFLPGGADEEQYVSGRLYERVTASQEMVHCILAVVFAGVNDSQETIRDATVMGFVYISEVDEVKGRVKILAPLNTRITDRPMIWGSWPEPTMSLVG
ncbi:Pre-mRNA cleavage complex II protein Clp1-domain-containing protein [Bisporella sp. PMI_857]|nr:Pre-mRNA cleavage complex II protein Clp1-domain-containing protein [Bisporella sp. PMI_857]